MEAGNGWKYAAIALAGMLAFSLVSSYSLGKNRTAVCDHIQDIYVANDRYLPADIEEICHKEPYVGQDE